MAFSALSSSLLSSPQSPPFFPFLPFYEKIHYLLGQSPSLPWWTLKVLPCATWFVPFALCGWTLHLDPLLHLNSCSSFQDTLKCHLLYRVFPNHPTKRNHSLFWPHSTIFTMVFVTLDCNSLNTICLHLCTPCPYSLGVLSTCSVVLLLWYYLAGKNANNPVKKSLLITDSFTHGLRILYNTEIGIMFIIQPLPWKVGIREVNKLIEGRVASQL